MAVSATALAACGGGKATHSSATHPPRSVAAPTSGGERSAKALLARVALALSHVHSFHMSGFVKTRDGSTSTIAATFQLPGRFRLQIGKGQERSEILATGQSLYVMANRAFWLDHAPLAAPSLSGKWVRLSRDLPGMEMFFALTRPRALGHCVAESHMGKVALAGTASVEGRSAVVVVSRGGVPGSAPGRAYIARSGPPLPLRLMQTGPRMAGGSPDPICGETAATVAASLATVRSAENFSAYNQPVTITAPRHAIAPGTSTQHPTL